MKTKAIVAFSTITAALALTANLYANGCVTCISTQECVPGGNGKQCTIFEYDERLWCNYEVGCNLGMAPLDLSPAGTYLGHETVRLADRGVDVVPCNQFIVSHVAAGPAGEVGEIRI